MEDSYEVAALEHKSRIVADLLDEIRPETVWDLGANTGHFSKLASERGCLTLALDKDPSAHQQIATPQHEHSFYP